MKLKLNSERVYFFKSPIIPNSVQSLPKGRLAKAGHSHCAGAHPAATRRTSRRRRPAALTVFHEALAAIRLGPAAAALVEASPPQRGRLDVVARLQPAAAGQRDDVKGDGAEQEQGQDPPAALAGQAAAQHLDGGARRRGARGARERRRVARERRPRDKRDEAAPGPTQIP